MRHPLDRRQSSNVLVASRATSYTAMRRARGNVKKGNRNMKKRVISKSAEGLAKRRAHIHTHVVGRRNGVQGVRWPRIDDGLAAVRTFLLLARQQRGAGLPVPRRERPEQERAVPFAEGVHEQLAEHRLLKTACVACAWQSSAGLPADVVVRWAVADRTGNRNRAGQQS